MCAIVGIYGNDNAARLASAALFAMQHRGHEATGISSGGYNDKKIYTVKNRGYVRDVYDEKAFKIILKHKFSAIFKCVGRILI
jgi:amidophosphoribosyltransferase